MIAPDDDGDDLVPALREAADDRYVLVCRVGGRPSWLELVGAFLRRDPIEAVTVLADDGAEEGEELSLTVSETDVPGVYETVAE